MIMLYGDYITLISQKTEQDKDGYQSMVETEREVFADIRSVTHSEFYEAMQSGMKASLIFKISVHDYENERLLVYDNTRYDIIRTYRIDLDHIELTCEEVQRQ